MQIGDSWLFSSQFCQCAVIFALFFFFFCDVGCIFLFDNQSVTKLF